MTEPVVYGAPRLRWVVPLVWVLALAPVLLLGLHAKAILPLDWSERPLDGFQPVGGFSYAVPIGTTWMNRKLVGDTPAQVFEDGRLLPCPNPPGGETAELGRGRYQMDGQWVFLAASDNSDPRTNGRRYHLRWPTPPSERLLSVVKVWSQAGVLVGLWFSRRAMWTLLRRPPLWLSLAVVIVPLAAHRWWFFFDVPLPAVHPDSGSYYALARLIWAGEWPHFEIRPLAYPLFLSAVLGTTRSLMGLMIVQTLMTAASACVLVFAVHRLRRPLALWAAIGMAGFVTGLWPIEHDTAVLSENLYVNGIVFGLGFMILALAAGRGIYFAAASTALGVTILTRPAGLFLVVPYVMCLAFLIWNGRSRPHIVAFALPLPLLILSMSSYNYVTSKVFNVTAWGEANLAVATFTMWRGHPSYPDDVNAKIAVIRGMIDERMTDQERAALAGSWDPDLLAPALFKGFWNPALNAASTIGADYLESRRWIRRISLDSIRSRPSAYAKFVWTMSYLFYVKNVRYTADFGDFMRFRVQNLFTTQVVAQVGQDPLRTEMVQTFLHRELPAAVRIGGECAGTANAVTLLPTASRRVHWLVQGWRDALFATSTWAYAFAAVLLAAVVRLTASRGRHLGAFVLVLIGVSLVSAGTIVCLVEYANQRYSYPTEFIYYVTVALAPLLWTNPRFDPQP